MLLAGSGSARSAPPGPSPAQAVETKVIAYYFHTTARCTTCRAIERYSREVVEGKFSAEIVKGRLQFKLVNIELPENRRFVKDYQLFTKSLVLVRFDKGRQAEYKVLNETWELVGDKAAMQAFVEREVRDYL
ncbi:MAG: nitrophenyl compound nitroreductase subunit ArsF family protein, partial [Acidobacteria bacterium]|nr:nitrophenyl compound nitroreductase subunit ArsF family protein [Acidobacteriota bacterium]